jgi:peptide chain release factor subunit 1
VSNNALAVYGYEKTREALSKNQASTLIINDELEVNRITYKCSACNQVIERMEIGEHRETRHDDGGTLNIVEKKDAIEELIEMADKNDTEVMFVSGESPLGKEFLMGFRGIAAILRYK